MSSARQQILQQLRSSAPGDSARTVPPQVDCSGWSRSEKVTRLRQQMEAVHTEVHQLPAAQWPEWLARELPRRGLNQIIAAPVVAEPLSRQPLDGVQIHHYDRPVEQWKRQLFSEMDAALTTTRGGVASSGSLVLWPSVEEPRLMSLVPPVHIALLQADQIYDTLEQMMEAEQWSRQMPTNALLISGPSKTADIQQVLAYGVHGPKALIVLILE